MTTNLIFDGPIPIEGYGFALEGKIFLGFIVHDGGVDDWGNPRVLLMGAYIRKTDVASVFDWKIEGLS